LLQLPRVLLLTTRLVLHMLVLHDVRCLLMLQMLLLHVQLLLLLVLLSRKLITLRGRIGIERYVSPLI
jgi:hypothetical protein